MKIYKFVIPPNKWVQDPERPALQWQGCVAAVIAPDQETAVTYLEKFAAMNGYDARWLRVARCAELPLEDQTAIVWAEM